MASNDSGEIFVPGNGVLWVAPYGATLPDLDDVTDTPVDTVDPDFVQLGFIDENGISLQKSRTVGEVPVMQSPYPARYTLDSESLAVRFALRQWNDQNLNLWLGGATVTDEGGSIYSIVMPTSPSIQDLTLVVELEDGDKHHRIAFPKGMITETDDVQLVRTAAGNLAMTFGVTPDGTNPPLQWATDDPAFDPATS